MTINSLAKSNTTELLDLCFNFRKIKFQHFASLTYIYGLKTSNFIRKIPDLNFRLLRVPKTRAQKFDYIISSQGLQMDTGIRVAFFFHLGAELV